jgi:F-type H+-transporting ATPase subunit delta
MSMPLADAQMHHAIDVDAERIARVYAESLYAAAPSGQAQEVGEELHALINEALPQQESLRNFFTSGVISGSKKKEVLEKTFRGKASDTFTDFLLVLNSHDRLNLLIPIYHGYRRLLDEQNKRVRVLVTSAAPLDEQQKENLIAGVRSSFLLEPILHEQVDPQLLSGFVIRVGDWQFDGTLRSRLNQLKNQLLERSSHEIQGRRDRFSTV